MANPLLYPSSGQSACPRGIADPAAIPGLTQTEPTQPDPIHHHARYRPGTEFIFKLIYPLLDFSLSFGIWSRLRDILVRIPNPHCIGTKTPIYTRQRARRTLGDHWTRVSTAFWSNWTGQGARGEWREASHPILEAKGWPEEILDAGQGSNEEATVAQSPCRSLPPTG
jgi:hypothetical protein